MSKHSHGEWYIDGHEIKTIKPEREFLGVGAPETICEMLSSVSPEETTANGILIAAATDLLEACKAALAFMSLPSVTERLYEQPGLSQGDEEIEKLNAAIAKATHP